MGCEEMDFHSLNNLNAWNCSNTDVTVIMNYALTTLNRQVESTNNAVNDSALGTCSVGERWQ